MPRRDVDALETLVGESHVTVDGLTVEAGKVEEFARAVGDDNPAHRDEAAASEQGHGAIPAPLTFTRVARFPRYQTYDDENAGEYMGFDFGLRREHALHGEQRYEFKRPVYVGDTLTGTTNFEDVYQREGGRGGTMTFFELTTEYRDQDGDLVVTEHLTLIETAGDSEGSS